MPLKHVLVFLTLLQISSRLCWTALATEDGMMDFGEIYLFSLGTFRLWSIAIVNHYRPEVQLFLTTRKIRILITFFTIQINLLVLKVLVLLVTVIVFDWF